MRFAPWSARPAEPPVSDAVLAGRAADGDTAALDTIYRRESGPVYRYALAMCGNPASAADATQEAFLALVTRPQAYDATHGSLGAYLAGVARHVLLAQWRRQQRQVDADAAAADDDEPMPAEGSASEALSPEAMLVRHQTVDAVWQGLRRLPWAMREAVVLVDLQERSYQQAAEVAGIDVNTLRTRLHRGRHRLAQRLAEGDHP